MRKVVFILLISFLLAGCDSTQNQYNSDTNSYENLNILNSRVEDSYDIEEGYDYGYEWAEDNDIDNFDDCQDQFGTSEEEDGCNDYIKDNYTGNQEFNGYDCTEDCSGHEAGYQWAEDKGIEDVDDCGGNSQSFIDGCQSYVEENY